MSAVHSRFVSVGGLRLHYVEAGAGPPVLLLHGIPTSSYLWRKLVPVLSPERRVIAPDLVGFGQSDKPRFRPYTVVSEADAIEGLLAALGIQRFALVGHDLGALVGAELIARDPARPTRLVLTNTSLRYDAWHGLSPLSLLRLPLAGEVAVWLARKWMLALAMRIYLAPQTRLTGAELAEYWRPFERGFKDVLLKLYRAPVAAAPDFARWRTALAALEVPCLLAWGALDPTFGVPQARDLARLMPDATVYVFEHANHFIQEDRPAALARLIDAFLAGSAIPDRLPPGRVGAGFKPASTRRSPRPPRGLSSP